MLDLERIRLRRLQLRLTQGELGKMIGQDQAYISRLERGHFDDITVSTLEKLARALRVSVEMLIMPDVGQTMTGGADKETESEHLPHRLALASTEF
jgi:putative transcriptional regulator